MRRDTDPAGFPHRTNRRDWMRIGGIGLGGLMLPLWLRDQAASATQRERAKAKSVIVLFNSGGMGQHETFDPKPDGPKETRGDFGAIATKTPGLLVGELMPRTAEITDRIAVIRSMATGDNAHSTSGYQMLTGIPHIPLSRENARPGKPNDAPSFNALVQALRPPKNGLPASISLPRRLANNGGQDPWPGTDAGLLGPRFDPWFLDCDPSDPGFTVPGGEFPKGMTQSRFERRLALFEQMPPRLTGSDDSPQSESFARYQHDALELIAGGKARVAFELDREPAALRERYTRTKWGQSVLLARRLVEAGVSLVQVQWASDDKNRPNSGGWDTHEKHSESIKGWLLPVLDQVYSTLILDLEERGLLDETLVCLVSEFGHTPKFNAKKGRDHWGRVFSIALAGGGIKPGIVYGKTDAQSASPLDEPVRPSDYLATVFHLLGYSPETVVHDREGRPYPISHGRVVDAVLA